jgi:hypothetical protein
MTITASDTSYDGVRLPLRTEPGRIHKDPTSEKMLGMLQGWANESLRSHAGCPNNKANHLPSRVLDVRPAQGENMIRLQQTHHLEGRYMALSYCWGNKTPPKTERKNLAVYESGILLFDLLATYIDAVRVARALSIPFLWIDSLCIIQDDDTDRDYELGRMQNTFRNASLVLIAASAEDPFEGFLNPRQIGLWSSPTIFQPNHG